MGPSKNERNQRNLLGHLISYRSLNREQDNVTVVSNFESGRHHREYATPQLQAPGPCRTEFSDVGFDLIVVGTKFLMNSIVQTPVGVRFVDVVSWYCCGYDNDFCFDEVNSANLKYLGLNPKRFKQLAVQY